MGHHTSQSDSTSPDLTGPLVLNRNTPSYWGQNYYGEKPHALCRRSTGRNLADILAVGPGKRTFDGAWLEENFENLNPGNTLWSKQYNLYANVDTEKHRYLIFEKWWDGYSYMTKEEIHEIVGNLFVGDQLEKGKLGLHGQKILNLKNIEKPLLIFASRGDNITPPQQALDWIIKEYSSVEEIKRLGKVIIYLLHPEVGHLGIFVCAKIARREHNEIIKSIEVINALPPGLYEMIIIDKGKEEGVSNYDVRFDERDIKDLMALNEDSGEMLEEDADFTRVEAVSEMNDMIYNTFFSPWVKMLSNITSAEIFKQLHPLRVNKYIFSDRINTFMLPFMFFAPLVQGNRKPAQADNVFLELQNRVSDVIVSSLDDYQGIRDKLDENLFFAIYESPMMKLLLPGPSRRNLRSKESMEGKAAEQIVLKRSAM